MLFFGLFISVIFIGVVSADHDGGNTITVGVDASGNNDPLLVKDAINQHITDRNLPYTTVNNPLLRTTGNTFPGGKRSFCANGNCDIWGPNKKHDGADNVILEKACEILGYGTVDSRECLDVDNKCSYDPSGSNKLTVFDKYQNDFVEKSSIGHTTIYARTWISKLVCSNKLKACNDKVDNDDDGKIDALVEDSNPKGAWIEAWNQNCATVCSSKSMVNVRDSNNQACASGERRSTEAIKQLGAGIYKEGCWNVDCVLGAATRESDTVGNYCYELAHDSYGGQKQDNDATDITAACYCEYTGPACNDGLDNDGDGKTDYNSDSNLGDPGCFSATDTSEIEHDSECANIDDDSEGPDTALPECSDGIDNDDTDADNLFDFCLADGSNAGTCDPDCDDADDDSETPECSDGINNDGDTNDAGDPLIDFGTTDTNDSDCDDADDNSETSECSDGIDNDGDTFCDTAGTTCIGIDNTDGDPECDDADDNDEDVTLAVVDGAFWENLIDERIGEDVDPSKSADLTDVVKLVVKGSEFEGKVITFTIIEEGQNTAWQGFVNFISFGLLYRDQQVTEIIGKYATWEATTQGRYFFRAEVEGAAPEESGILEVSNTEDNDNPVVTITSPEDRQIFFKGQNLHFTATVSDPDDLNVDWSWDLGEPNRDPESGTINTLTETIDFIFPYPTPGQKDAVLTINDGSGTGLARISILIIASDFMLAYIDKPVFGERSMVQTVEFDARGTFAVSSTRTITDTDSNTCSYTITCLAGNCPSTAGVTDPADCPITIDPTILGCNYDATATCPIPVANAPSDTNPADYTDIEFDWTLKEGDVVKANIVAQGGATNPSGEHFFHIFPNPGHYSADLITRLISSTPAPTDPLTVSSTFDLKLIPLSSHDTTGDTPNTLPLTVSSTTSTEFDVDFTIINPRCFTVDVPNDQSFISGSQIGQSYWLKEGQQYRADDSRSAGLNNCFQTDGVIRDGDTEISSQTCCVAGKDCITGECVLTQAQGCRQYDSDECGSSNTQSVAEDEIEAICNSNPDDPLCGTCNLDRQPFPGSGGTCDLFNACVCAWRDSDGCQPNRITRIITSGDTTTIPPTLSITYSLDNLPLGIDDTCGGSVPTDGNDPCRTITTSETLGPDDCSRIIGFRRECLGTNCNSCSGEGTYIIPCSDIIRFPFFTMINLIMTILSLMVIYSFLIIRSKKKY